MLIHDTGKLCACLCCHYAKGKPPHACAHECINLKRDGKEQLVRTGSSCLSPWVFEASFCFPCSGFPVLTQKLRETLPSPIHLLPGWMLTLLLLLHTARRQKSWMFCSKVLLCVYLCFRCETDAQNSNCSFKRGGAGWVSINRSVFSYSFEREPLVHRDSAAMGQPVLTANRDNQKRLGCECVVCLVQGTPACGRPVKACRYFNYRPPIFLLKHSTCKHTLRHS